MHIPDGFIPLWQTPIYFAIAVVALIFALRWAKNNLDERNIPLLSVLAAFIFVIMSINIPIPWGTSGHMVGAAMVAIIFMSPWAGVICISLVLLIQGLFFGDGGITVLGANMLNMGIIGSFVGYYGFVTLRKPLGKKLAIGVASWAAIFLSAIAASLELWWAGTFPLELGLLFMGLYHAVIGILEASITVVVILALEKVRPDLLAWNKDKYKDKFADLRTKSIEVKAK